MGAENSIYIGTYIRVPSIIQKYEFEYKCCINTECVSYKKEFSGNYCSKCGGKISQEIKVQDKKINFTNEFIKNDISEDSLYEPTNCGSPINKAYSFFIPNSKKVLHTIHNLNSKEQVFQINKIDESIEDFKKVYSKEIEVVEKICGKENITIEYGVISSWN